MVGSKKKKKNRREMQGRASAILKDEGGRAADGYLGGVFARGK